MDMNYIRITTNIEFPHLHSFHNGKHITLQVSICSGSNLHNHKHYFRITLLVIINTMYCFTYVGVGHQGHIFDRGDL